MAKLLEQTSGSMQQILQRRGAKKTAARVNEAVYAGGKAPTKRRVRTQPVVSGRESYGLSARSAGLNNQEPFK